MSNVTTVINFAPLSQRADLIANGAPEKPNHRWAVPDQVALYWRFEKDDEVRVYVSADGFLLLYGVDQGHLCGTVKEVIDWLRVIL